MLPFKSIIVLDRKSRCPLYLQIVKRIIHCTTSGSIPSNYKLPGARSLAKTLAVSRRTVMLAYEELEAQGWITIIPNKGSFISNQIPVSNARKLVDYSSDTISANSNFPRSSRLDFLGDYLPSRPKNIRHVIDTGYPDVRLAPAKELARTYANVIRSRQDLKILNYASDFQGHSLLRQALAQYLADSRGIQVAQDGLMITRGSLMAFNMIFQVLLSPGDIVIVGDVSFQVAKDIVRIHGGELLSVRVDQDGLCVDEIAEICKRSDRVRVVFVMPHHHHPTTVSLSAARRMRLLQLAQEHQFAIVEDDYDYDFHYSSSPLLPMASADPSASVIYVGSFSKTVAPGLRIGFVVAASNLIKDLCRLGRFLDCHGNTSLEKTMGLLLRDGTIRRHLKKSLKIYRERCDLFCDLLQEHMGDQITFVKPEGGLAVWVIFDEEIKLPQLREEALKRSLLISRTDFYQPDGRTLNALRLGFGSLDKAEMHSAIGLLAEAVQATLG